MAENRNAQQVREITDKLEQGLKDVFGKIEIEQKGAKM